MLGDIGVIIGSIDFKSLNELLELSSIPIRETFWLDEILLNLHLWSEHLALHAFDVATVLWLHFDQNEFS